MHGTLLFYHPWNYFHDDIKYIIVNTIYHFRSTKNFIHFEKVNNLHMNRRRRKKKVKQYKKITRPLRTKR